MASNYEEQPPRTGTAGERKQQSFGKTLALSLGAFSLLAALFAGLIALTSHASFLIAFGWIMAFLAMVMIPTFVWLYVLEPLWRHKLPLNIQKKVKVISEWSFGALVVTALVLVVLGVAGGDTWSGQGQVDMFPQGSTSKNYIVDARMSVTSKWWWQEDYGIKSVTWPDGGSSYFDNCVLHDSSEGFSCTDNNGRSWMVSLTQAPDRSDYNQ